MAPITPAWEAETGGLPGLFQHQQGAGSREGWHKQGLSPEFKAYFVLALFSFENTTNATGQSLRKHRAPLLDLDTNRVLGGGGLPSVHRAFLGILVHSWSSLGGAACFRVIADARQQEAHVRAQLGALEGF